MGYFPGFLDRRHPLRACRNLYQQQEDTDDKFVEKWLNSPSRKWRDFQLMAKNPKFFKDPPSELRLVLKVVGGWPTLEKKAWLDLGADKQQCFIRVVENFSNS